MYIVQLQSSFTAQLRLASVCCCRKKKVLPGNEWLRSRRQKHDLTRLKIYIIMTLEGNLKVESGQSFAKDQCPMGTLFQDSKEIAKVAKCERGLGHNSTIGELAVNGFSHIFYLHGEVRLCRPALDLMASHHFRI